MPLSEHEQRLLEQIERALYDEDPKFAHSWRTKDLHSVQRARLLRALAALLVGLGLLVAGVVVQGSSTVVGVALGVAGFLALLAGAWMVLSSRRPVAVAVRPTAGPRAGIKRPGGKGPSGKGLSIKQRLEERWERRQDGR